MAFKIHDDILGLEITENDVLGVQVRQSKCNFANVKSSFRLRKRLASRQSRKQITTAAVFHHQKQAILRLEREIKCDDIRVVRASLQCCLFRVNVLSLVFLDNSLLVVCLECIELVTVRSLTANKIDLRESTATQNLDEFEITGAQSQILLVLVFECQVTDLGFITLTRFVARARRLRGIRSSQSRSTAKQNTNGMTDWRQVYRQRAASIWCVGTCSVREKHLCNSDIADLSSKVDSTVSLVISCVWIGTGKQKLFHASTITQTNQYTATKHRISINVDSRSIASAGSKMQCSVAVTVLRANISTTGEKFLHSLGVIHTSGQVERGGLVDTYSIHIDNIIP